LTKYLTKSVSGCHMADTPAQEQHRKREVRRSRRHGLVSRNMARMAELPGWGTRRGATVVSRSGA